MDKTVCSVIKTVCSVILVIPYTSGLYTIFFCVCGGGFFYNNSNLIAFEFFNG